MEQKGVVFTRKASGLVRELSWVDVFIFVIAGPAASGITYFSVARAADYPGGSIPLGFVIGLAMFVPICALIAMTSAMMPRSGGLYVTVSRVVDPTVGYLCGWMFFVGYGLTIGVLSYVVMGIMGGMFQIAGLAGGMDFLTRAGYVMQTVLGRLISGIIWLAFFWAVMIRGIRSIKKVMRIIFAIPLLATGIIVVSFLVSGPQSAANLFDATWGAGTFDAVKQAAQSLGWGFPSFSWPETVNALMVVIWAYVAIEAISFAGGEIKQPKTSMMRGFLWGCIAVGVMYVVVSFASYYPFKEFIGAYDFLYDDHPEVLKEIFPGGAAIPPSVPFYAASIMRSKILGLLVSASIALWYANTILPCFLANSRLAFAMAMDKAMPDAIASVNPRTGSPTWAVHITGLFALLGILIQALNIGTILGILNITALFIFWAFGLAGMLLPFLKPEIYERSPVRWKWFGVDLIVILGMITFVEGWFFLFLSAMEFNRAILLVTLFVLFLGMVIYLVQQRKNVREGVDISRIYSQIPPE
jgi:APA family basic amino acid/polyamine antiporter